MQPDFQAHWATNIQEITLQTDEIIPDDWATKIWELTLGTKEIIPSCLQRINLSETGQKNPAK